VFYGIIKIKFMNSSFKIILPLFFAICATNAMAQSSGVLIQSPENKKEFCANQTITLVAKIDIPQEELTQQKWIGDNATIDKELGNILILRPKKSGEYSYTFIAKNKAGKQFADSIKIRINEVATPMLTKANSTLKVDIKNKNMLRSINYFYNGKEITEIDFRKAQQKGKYWVVCTSSNGCSTSSNVIIKK
jgi:hypothetical protein